jgi:hypothetical protein
MLENLACLSDLADSDWLRRACSIRTAAVLVAVRQSCAVRIRVRDWGHRGPHADLTQGAATDGG